MARLARLYFPGCVQHVIQRGNNREACFYDEADYTVYLSFLNESAKKYRVAIHAFVLMTNHVHLLATPSDEQGISRLMQALGRRYVQYFNFTYGRTGTLWEGRYKSTLVDSDSYLLTVYRYLEPCLSTSSAFFGNKPGGGDVSSGSSTVDIALIGPGPLGASLAGRQLLGAKSIGQS